MTERRYLAPDWFTLNVFNPVMKGLTQAGMSVWGSRILEVKGRSSGEWRSVPVNLLTLDGVEYLVAPRGETQWVRNLRVAGEGRLRLGKKTTTFTAEEIADDAKAVILRPYLKRWKWEVGQFFDGVGPDATEEELIRISSNHPVFRIQVADLGD
jgi:deazaflavin-dependent oxidoreductase (nitroreductase family)